MKPSDRLFYTWWKENEEGELVLVQIAENAVLNPTWRGRLPEIILNNKPSYIWIGALIDYNGNIHVYDEYNSNWFEFNAIEWGIITPLK